MQVLIATPLTFLLVCCTPAKPPSDQQKNDGSQQSAETPTPVVGTPPPAAVKENLTLIGAVVTGIELTGDIDYVLHLELRTAIPLGGTASLAEPGQSLAVHPGYRKNEQGEISLSGEQNKRLHDLRSLKEGEFVLGRISLGQDGIWYIMDTGVE